MTRLRRFTAAAAAAAGLVGAHALDYALLIPDPAHRHDVLLKTGHGWVPFGLAIAAVTALAALASALALGARGRAPAAFPTGVMALVQGGGFVALEAIERLGAGAGFDRSVIAIVALGVVLQAVVAAVTCRVLGLTAKVAAAIARLLAPRAWPLPLPRTISFRSRSLGAPLAPHGAPHGVRGPPRLLSV